MTAGTPWLYFFLDFALGHAVDRPLSAWEESFLPGKLAEHLRAVRVPDGHGGLQPLVKVEHQLTTSQYAMRADPPKWFAIFLSIGVGFGAILSVLAMLGRNAIARWVFCLLAMGWSLVAGLLGALMTYAWFSDHTAAMWNENWFQGNPLSLLLVVLIPANRRCPRATRVISFGVLGLSLADLAAKVTPWAWQGNGAIIALALPVHLAIAGGILRLRSLPLRKEHAIPAS